MSRSLVCVALLSAVCSLGCVDYFINRTVDKAVNTAADRVGQRIGEAVAGAILRDLTPELLQAYSVAAFQVLFYHGGYHMESMDYKVGQYTRWDALNVQQGEQFERALLFEREDGAQWWRVESSGKDDQGKEQRLIMEALIAKADATGNRQIRRMRAQFPGEAEPREIAITEQNASSWVLRSDRKLTPESMEGMTVGTEKVKVPAGEFTARHVRMKGYDGEQVLDWYVVETVPGQMVKYTNSFKDSDGKQEVVWQMVLRATGDGMNKSKLGIDFSPAKTASAQ
jgi:hypothetical protein